MHLDGSITCLGPILLIFIQRVCVRIRSPCFSIALKDENAELHSFAKSFEYGVPCKLNVEHRDVEPG
jgi:hypothetical protein